MFNLVDLIKQLSPQDVLYIFMVSFSILLVTFAFMKIIVGRFH